jgi:hypothetical protein
MNRKMFITRNLPVLFTETEKEGFITRILTGFAIAYEVKLTEPA